MLNAGKVPFGGVRLRLDWHAVVVAAAPVLNEMIVSVRGGFMRPVEGTQKNVAEMHCNN